MKLTTDRDVITDDGRNDAYLQVEVLDAQGNGLTNSPSITLTDKSGLGLFPTGKSITFDGASVEHGVVDGKSAIE